MDLKSPLRWLDAYLAAVRDIPSSALLFFCAVAAVLLGIVFIKWRGATRRVRAFANKNASLKVDLAIARTSREYEKKWRVAVEATLPRFASSSNVLEPKTPRELQDFLAKDFHNAMGTVA
jgi:hypothetical protein